MNEHDAILAALERIATQAPPPDRVVANLSARIRAHRQRRALLTLGGAAAVGVPAFIVLRPDQAGPGPGPAPASAGPDPSPRPGNTWAPMLFRPTWLPDGVTEVSRVGHKGDEPGQSRIWADDIYRRWAETFKDETLRESRFVGVDVKRAAELATRGPVSPPVDVLGGEPNTTVGDHPAYVTDPDDDLAEVTWLVDNLLIKVTVSPAAGGYDAALRVARSVVPDRTSRVEVGFSLRWLPARFGRTGWRVTSSVTATKWSQQLVSLHDDFMVVGLHSPGFFPTSDTNPDDTQITVRGRQGTLSDGVLLVELADGSWLRVGAGNRTEAVRIANDLIIGQPAYRGWVGTR
ncbi:hypothetical protein [Luedemannella helvata]|uniref:Uncharacterized protein n=1 Tax=Luedemannella helvata TaxID=349315 RepID=A0ABP4WAN6_9ACTN